MTTSTVSSKNQVVIPTAVRVSLGIKSGDKIMYITRTDGSITIRKQSDDIYDFVGILGPSQGDPVARIRTLRDLDD